MQDTTYSNLPLYFWGWYKEKSLSNRVLGIHNGASGDRTYYAKWLQYKMQYKGNYITTSKLTANIESSSYKFGYGVNEWYKSSFNSPVKFSKDVKIVSAFANFDFYEDGTWANYKKPKVEIGYYTSDSVSGWHKMADLYSEGQDPYEKSVSFTLPAGAWIGFHCKCTDGARRNTGYLYSGAFVKYDGSETKTVDWQDSANPPSGSWASGYPEKKYVQRHYNYDTSSFTSWENV